MAAKVGLLCGDVPAEIILASSSSNKRDGSNGLRMDFRDFCCLEGGMGLKAT